MVASTPTSPSAQKIESSSHYKPLFHPALSVSNIRNHVSVVLELENSQYGTWAELFKIHDRSHKVDDHILDPPKVKNRRLHLLLLKKKHYGLRWMLRFSSGFIQPSPMICWILLSNRMLLLENLGIVCATSSRIIKHLVRWFLSKNSLVHVWTIFLMLLLIANDSKSCGSIEECQCTSFT